MLPDRSVTASQTERGTIHISTALHAPPPHPLPFTAASVRLDSYVRHDLATVRFLGEATRAMENGRQRSAGEAASGGGALRVGHGAVAGRPGMWFRSIPKETPLHCCRSRMESLGWRIGCSPHHLGALRARALLLGSVTRRRLVLCRGPQRTRGVMRCRAPGEAPVPESPGHRAAVPAVRHRGCSWVPPWHITASRAWRHRGIPLIGLRPAVQRLEGR